MSGAPRSSGSWARVYGAPIVIGLLSLTGLSSALLLGDIGRYLAWPALGVPILIVAWRLLRR